MVEIVLAVSAVVLIYRVAELDKQSGLAWGAIMAGAAVAAVMLIPWPFFRLGLAVLAVFVGMVLYRMVAER